ncbi:cysteine methyltransferase [Candidatus Woesearchaeota archaeon]|nr:cysteine methyltransferase [Candidatus Woesearchaeota archaeon]|tara:strand:+ start:2241 stop:2540 length:300 start_codon:yes stop_codon:yes gene_type:complete
MNNLRNKVLKLTSGIPKGNITTYKILAEKLGTKAYRAVGTALKNNPTPIIIPCHRVVKSNGELGEFSSKVYKKEDLLREEGIEIKNNRIVDFKEKLYRF